MKKISIETGSAGEYVIGSSKSEILNSAVRSQAFSPRPKPAECQDNWIKVSLMSETQKNCLISSNEWVIEQSNFHELCKPDKADTTVKLFFNEDKLSGLLVECWMPK